MYGLYIALVIYFGIAICIYLGICMGTFDLRIQSKKTGEFLEVGSREYEMLKFVFSMAWVVMAIQTIRRGGDNDGQDN